MSKSISKLMMLFGLVLFTTLSTAGAAAASDWEWSITPYAWAIDVSADISINDRQVADQEIDASGRMVDRDIDVDARFNLGPGGTLDHLTI